MQEMPVQFQGPEDPWRREWLPTPKSQTVLSDTHTRTHTHTHTHHKAK